MSVKKTKFGEAKAGLTKIWWGYRGSARRRGLAFELTKEEFARMTKENCWYCGAQPSQVARDGSAQTKSIYLYNGIDRVDNKVGYILGNCVPCCSMCNRMKSVYHCEDFIAQIRRIVNNLDMF